MNKRQRKKQNTDSKKSRSNSYKVYKKLINFYTDKKINNKIRWRVLEKVHIQEEKSRWKRMIKNMYRFYAGEIEFDEVFEKIK